MQITRSQIAAIASVAEKLPNLMQRPLSEAERESIIQEAMSRASLQARPADLRELGAAASVATVEAPYKATLHALMTEYYTSSTPMGAAVRVYQHLTAKVTHGTPVDIAIRELATNAELLRTVVTSASKAGVPHVYSLDGGQLDVIINPDNVNPQVLVAQASDAVTSHYLRQPEVLRARVAPGVIAMRTKSLPNDIETEDDLVWVVANDKDPNVDYAQGLNGFRRPRYIMVTSAPGVPAGLPIGTACRVNLGLPGSHSVKVWSVRDTNKDPKLRWKVRSVLFDPNPCWQYTDAGLTAMITQIYAAMSASVSVFGDGQANATGSALHHKMMVDDSTSAAVRAQVPQLSHAALPEVTGSAAAPAMAARRAAVPTMGLPTWLS